jgi:lysophospholipase L1-like esterase
MTAPRPRPEHRVGAMAAYLGGGLTAAAAVGAGVLFGQAVAARWTIPGAEAPPPRCGGDYGTEFGPGAPLRLAVLGDSTAAGYGVHTRAETPGALLATWISTAARRPVRRVCPAVVGSVSAWLPAQVERAVEAGVDLAVIFIGANDVTTRASESAAVRHLYEAVHGLREVGAEVVVATCPDLGAIAPIKPPLRWAARRWSRQLAAAQTVAVVRAGGRTVSLGDLLGPQFAAEPTRFFGADRYHPSAEGYQLAASVVLPSALAAVGLGPERVEPVGELPSLPDAAAVAAAHPGTEVRPSDVDPARPAAPRPAPADRIREGYARLRRRVVDLTRRSIGQAAAKTVGLAVPSGAGVPSSAVAAPFGADRHGR